MCLPTEPSGVTTLSEHGFVVALCSFARFASTQTRGEDISGCRW
jgi:hypothetical protein